MVPGSYDFPPVTRGDTFVARPFAEVSRDGQPLEVSAARLQVRDLVGQRLLLEWSTAGETIVLSGDPVDYALALAEKSAEVMADVPPGVHAYDLEVTLAAGEVITLLAGKFPVISDVSR